MSRAFEVNFDGLVGPTHNYSGLSYGNLASMTNQASLSNPKEAALQGLEKMKFLHSLGIKQAILPPHERPHFPTLRRLGFEGTEADILRDVYKNCPELLYNCSSAAGMWVANAGSCTPSIDSRSNHVHFSAANLISKFHRSIEANFTSKLLKLIFRDPVYFKHHEALPATPDLADEGAANQIRLCSQYQNPGINLFVYGRYAWQKNPVLPHLFPARQTYEASQFLAKRHAIPSDQTIFAQQNPIAIDAGIFHNDVAAVGNQNVLIFHEEAYLDSKIFTQELQRKMEKICKVQLIPIEVNSYQVSLSKAVKSYLFNSQLVSLNNESMALIAPIECAQTPPVKMVIDDIIKDQRNPIKEVHYINLYESMRNGGGPACLRFRVVLTEKEISATHQGIFFTHTLYNQLKSWIQTHYRDHLIPNDLADPQLSIEIKYALDELTKILNLGSIYSFQLQ